MQSGYWGDRQRNLDRLDPAVEIGREAARRALRKLGARKVDTQSVPIVFESGATEDLLGSLFEAVSGSCNLSPRFLSGRETWRGDRFPAVTIIDDGMMPGAIGTRPFDSEGLPTRRTVVVDRGRLNRYLLEHLHRPQTLALPQPAMPSGD
jgi:PmbA protein